MRKLSNFLIGGGLASIFTACMFAAADSGDIRNISQEAQRYYQLQRRVNQANYLGYDSQEVKIFNQEMQHLLNNSTARRLGYYLGLATIGSLSLCGGIEVLARSKS